APASSALRPPEPPCPPSSSACRTATAFSTPSPITSRTEAVRSKDSASSWTRKYIPPAPSYWPGATPYWTPRSLGFTIRIEVSCMNRFTSRDRKGASWATLCIAVVLALATARAVPAADELPKAETILDKYIEVTGGKTAYQKL